MTIELGEDIGVKNIKEFYLRLKKIMKEEAEIILDFKKVTRIDLSLAQLLIAANREFMKRNKKFMLKSVSKEIKKQLYLAGFAQ